MTNEAQTNIIVTRVKKMLPMMKSTLGESIERYADFFKKSLLNMAEWKDQQYADIIKEESNASYESGLAEGERKAEARFKEYLEKKKADNPKSYRSDWKAYENGILHDIIDEIINELFKEE